MTLSILSCACWPSVCIIFGEKLSINVFCSFFKLINYFLAGLGPRCFEWVFFYLQRGEATPLWCRSFSLQWLLLLWSTVKVKRELSTWGLPALERQFSTCITKASHSTARGIFLDQGLNPCFLHWQANAYPLHHQGSCSTHCLNGLLCFFFFIVNCLNSLYQLLPDIFGTRAWCHGRQFFCGPGDGSGFRIIQMYYIYCAPCFCYYYINPTSHHQTLYP